MQANTDRFQTLVPNLQLIKPRLENSIRPCLDRSCVECRNRYPNRVGIYLATVGLAAEQWIAARRFGDNQAQWMTRTACFWPSPAKPKSFARITDPKLGF